MSLKASDSCYILKFMEAVTEAGGAAGGHSQHAAFLANLMECSNTPGVKELWGDCQQCIKAQRSLCQNGKLLKQNL